MDILVFSLFVLLAGAPLGYAVLQFHTLRRWRGGWRVAAMLPMVAVPALVGHVLLTGSAAAGAPNLTHPLEFMLGALAAMAGFGCLVTLALARRVARGGFGRSARSAAEPSGRDQPGDSQVAPWRSSALTSVAPTRRASAASSADISAS